MRTIVVTGPSGSGKSRLATELRTAGNYAVSADGDERLCSWTDAEGRRVARPADPEAEWLDAHRWTWHPARLDEIIEEARIAGARTLWLCGHAANQVDLAVRFDLVLLLEVDEATLLARLRLPSRGNDFGRTPAQLERALAERRTMRTLWHRFGAIPIDAAADIDTVLDEVLLAAARHVLATALGGTPPPPGPH